MIQNEKKTVEFRVVDDEELPPIIFSQTENNEVKVIINTYHRLWVLLNRRTILGSLESLGEKIDNILTAYLEEQHNFEKEDRELI